MSFWIAPFKVGRKIIITVRLPAVVVAVMNPVVVVVQRNLKPRAMFTST